MKNKNIDTHTVTRRDFLKMAATLSVGVTAIGFSSPLFAQVSGQQIEDDLKALIAGRKKDFIDYSRAKAIPTICFGCTTSCGVIGWVQDGKVRKIEGNPLDPNSQGNICSKANGMISYTYYPERLLYPIKRVGKRGEGKWRRVHWDEAIKEVGDKLKTCRESGHPERFIFHYGRDKTKGFTKRFTNAFGTPNRLNRRSICSSNRRAPLMSYFGRDFEWETQDLENTKYILNFGCNPMEAYQGGLYMMHRIQTARVDHGAKMVSFEVRPSATVNCSDEYYSVMPGSDGAIGFAMANVIIDEGLVDTDFWQRWSNVSLLEIKEHIKQWTPEFAEKESGVPANEIRRIAIEFAKAAPHCTTMTARGSAKHYNGYQADRGLRMLDVLVGNVGQKGGFCLSSLRMWGGGKYGQDGLPSVSQPKPTPPSPKAFLPGTAAYDDLPSDIKEKVNRLDPMWQKKYKGELATPAEYPLAWHWYGMKVGQLVQHYIREGRAKVDVYMSFTYGAAYGYPEANVCREVLLDEKLVPYHVAIDIAYSEHASLADMILPEATSLERWDPHSTNCYGLIPYTGIRQPLVKPQGEAREVQLIFKDLAHHIGGGMVKYFDFDNVEDFYKEWYKEVSAKFPNGWEEFKQRGIWQDTDRAKDYELFERPVPAKELAGSHVDGKTNIIYNTVKGKKKAIGIMMPDRHSGKMTAVRGFPTPSRLIQVSDPIFPLAAKSVGLPESDPNGNALPTYYSIPGFEDLEESDMILTTFKWNVHTQGRSAMWKYSAEIVHTNPLFINPNTAKKMGLVSGDEVEVTVKRPKGLTYRGNIDENVSVFRNTVRVLNGVHERVLCFGHGAGHWQQGSVSKGENRISMPSSGFNGEKKPHLHDQIWWSKELGGTGNGVPMNDNLPINPSPLVGGQNWFDSICKVRKV
ncbi:molybdopterin-containing oxidoreductase family protein [Aliivibrio kagoshimensis]|uniref:molybdopterin-containing oxidoreductase family protein n=1 Tax=Aliivibrio kagoshimensis TaxID=2910230 RepID=UPI003D0BAD95